MRRAADLSWLCFASLLACGAELAEARLGAHPPSDAVVVPYPPPPAKVEELPDGKWQATFEGECGRPYKYTIKMQGRQAGSVVMFQGSADLGEKDGGVFDWIGRANDKEFIGFFTSKGYTGVFRMTRAK